MIMRQMRKYWLWPENNFVDHDHHHDGSDDDYDCDDCDDDCDDSDDKVA